MEAAAAAVAARSDAMVEELLRVVAAAQAPRAAVDEIEYLLGDVLATLSRLKAKRGRLQGQIAAASRGRQQPAGHPRRAPPPAEDDDYKVPPVPAYTRKGVGAVRKRLRGEAGDVKKDRVRLEVVRGALEEALADAKARLALPLPPPPPPRAGNA